MHEVGHSLGAKHTFEGNNILSYMEDHRGLSVLSYIGTRMDVARWNLSLYDLAFVQYRYGVNPNARTGNDYLHGGKGADTFIFNTPLNGDIDRLADFNPNEDNIERALSVFNTLTSENLNTQIHYDAESGALSYSAEDNPVHFADLPSGLNIEPTWFVLA